ncbi:MAG: hypothetical protein B7Y56_00120 [Gallionellales bacterium 35-53-114]|jgi:hypothetical protein|nr:MAG: hypothetical protein B7Y56_00120 [Gallionellales bacterium 35-53-114]OYZ62245.1 MAG: hypothetical protein B7Y04_14755 [Gallionellales bacterium 24-53-125]OZB10634.1 MAG: hypothetical protein B7X61_03790 [Gallionellales bacterium 39-52-133]HQS57269.1 hypothetical protein [Gallionellaceae bacterium]HQS74543.1 hypothetical protein [Gallionellaceae bacterium]
MNKIFNKIKCLRKHPPRQRGAVLMVMLVILVTGGSAMLLSSLNSVTPRLARDKVTADALAQAKEALIGYAAKANTPGQFPCPEDTTLIGLPTEGTSKGTCTLPAIGRLPWRQLGLGPLRDGNSELLWYALSPGFRTSPINSDTPAQLTVDGAANSAIAIIFSAGSPVNGQTRPTPTSSAPPDPAQYLELSNSDGDNIFISSQASDTFNDRLMIIKTGDIISIVEKRVKKELEKAFLAYGSYPYPANFTCTSSASCVSDTASQPTCVGKIPVGNPGFTLPAWFVPNNWFDVVYYAASTSTLPLIGGGGMGGGGMGSASTGTGCFNPLIVSGTNVKAFFILPGTQLNGTGRANLSSGNLADYFEDDLNKIIDADYVIPSSSSNDTLHILP